MIHWPYALTEASYVASQLAWAVVFAAGGLMLPAIGAGFLAACVVYVGFFYGDHAGKVGFVFDRSRPRFLGSRRAGTVSRRTHAERPLSRRWITDDTS